MSDATAQWTPPSGYVEDHGHISRDLNISLMAIAAVFFVHRVYICLFYLKNWGADDLAATAAFALLCTLSAFEILAVHYGAGRHLVDVNPADLEHFFYNLPTMQLIYMASSFMVKLSIMLFLRRLHTNKTYLRVVWGGVVVLCIQTSVIMLMFAFQCRPPRELWDKNLPAFECMSSQDQAKLFYALAGSGIVIEVFCLVVPLVVIWKLLMYRKMKIRLTVVFGVGIFAIICALIRFTVIVTVDMGVDTTYNIGRASLWTNLECYFGFYVSCAPSLSPTFRFLRRVVTGQTTTSKTSQGKPTTIPLSVSRSGAVRSGLVSHISQKGGGSTGDIPMYSVSRIDKHDLINGSQDQVSDLDADNNYNDTPFKVRVEKEIYTAKDTYQV